MCKNRFASGSVLRQRGTPAEPSHLDEPINYCSLGSRTEQSNLSSLWAKGGNQDEDILWSCVLSERQYMEHRGKTSISTLKHLVKMFANEWVVLPHLCNVPVLVVERADRTNTPLTGHHERTHCSLLLL